MSREPKAIGQFLPGILREIKGPTLIQKRLIDGAALPIENPNALQNILFQHTVLCQTCLPFRNPGDQIRTWERVNGTVHLQLEAGHAMHPTEGRFVPLGLPFGPKARMILMHINQQALKQKTPDIEVEDSLTRFVKRTLNLDGNGRDMRAIKDQLGRLSASSIRLGYIKDGKAVTENPKSIVEKFDVWLPKDERQRILWPTTIHLNPEYFQSLKGHAVPLDEDHIARLSHSGLALDIYAWLANRLHRIPANAPARISWAALHGQFGQGYERINHFRAAFRVALKEVLALYRAARINLHEERKPPRIYSQGGKLVLREPPAKGLTLYNSPPPVSRRAG
jgi:Plasmid encoded RepA protein